MTNPFQQRGTIKNPKGFFGRHTELSRIASDVSHQQSCSIVGERRIGKSSLLWSLSHFGHIDTSSAIVCYHDLQSARYQTLTDFLRTIIVGWGGDASNITETNRPGLNLIGFSEELEKITSNGKNIVLCLDEFEALFEHRKQFTSDFFDHMRSEINGGSCIFITASQRGLQELSLEGKLTSPFYNVFTVTELREFLEIEAAEFLEYYYERDFLSDTDLIFIFNAQEDHRWHPLKLQIICDVLFESRGNSRKSEDELLEEIDRELKKYFVSTLKNWRRLKKLTSFENVKRTLELLKSGRSLITDGESKSSPTDD